MDFEKSYYELLKSYNELAQVCYRNNEELNKLRKENSRLAMACADREEIIRDILKRYNCNIDKLKETLNNLYGENARK